MWWKKSSSSSGQVSTLAVSYTHLSETIEDIYGFETSEGFISDVTDKIMPQIEDWQNRPLDEVYPILYIDAIHYSVRDNGVIRKLAAYVILGINTEGKKEVLSITVGDNESSKYWLSVLNELKNRGVKDILIICADGLSGIKEAIAAAFPKTEYQRCIVHHVFSPLPVRFSSFFAYEQSRAGSEQSLSPAQTVLFHQNVPR